MKRRRFHSNINEPLKFSFVVSAWIKILVKVFIVSFFQAWCILGTSVALTDTIAGIVLVESVQAGVALTGSSHLTVLTIITARYKTNNTTLLQHQLLLFIISRWNSYAAEEWAVVEWFVYIPSHPLSPSLNPSLQMIQTLTSAGSQTAQFIASVPVPVHATTIQENWQRIAAESRCFVRWFCGLICYLCTMCQLFGTRRCTADNQCRRTQNNQCQHNLSKHTTQILQQLPVLKLNSIELNVLSSLRPLVT